MDITQMKYFIAIVECGCNLSLAAKRIHISQSALSQFISNFEKEEEIELFVRKNGRFEELTPSGEKLYNFSLEIVERYREMRGMIRKESARQKGTVRIGMPSLILTVLFTNFFSTFLSEHPDVKIELVEEGSHELKRMMIAKDLDYVVLVAPTDLDPKAYEEHIIHMDEYIAFMRPDHQLAEKERLTWKDLSNQNIGTFKESFVTNQLVKEKLTENQVDAEVTLTSASWDFLVESCSYSDIISILPAPIKRYYKDMAIDYRPIKNPIPFDVLLCRPIKSSYSEVETFVHESMLNYFYQPMN